MDFDTLGSFLRDRRAKLDPVVLGFPKGRRRTPGLRREEVAQRANISTTWYTCLEQGRGGPPSADVLDRISRSLMLTKAQREHLFVLGLGATSEPRSATEAGVAPRLQGVLDALSPCPALIKNAAWDIVAWNDAAATLLVDGDPGQTTKPNLLRLMFSDSPVRTMQADWQSVARFIVGAFRADVTRAGLGSEMASQVEELCRISPEFEAIWNDHDVANHDERSKRLNHPEIGFIEFEFSSFIVEEHHDWAMHVYTPATHDAGLRVRQLIRSRHLRGKRNEVTGTERSPQVALAPTSLEAALK
jgi:transcriptional regulator with XRE-family HTH domain